MPENRSAPTSNGTTSAPGSKSVEQIPEERPYRSGEVQGKKLPGYLVRPLLTHLDTERVEWAALAIAARLSELTEASEADAVKYRNRHTGTDHTVERKADTIHKSRQSFVEDLRRRLYKKAATPSNRDWREDWSSDFEKDYDRIRRKISRLAEGEYLVNEAPAVQAEKKPIQDRNGRRWRVMPELRNQPEADPQRPFVRCTGPEPEIDRHTLHVDVLDNLERLVAYREELHESFTAGWKAEKRNGEWQPHKAKTNARQSHRWYAQNGSDRPQYVSVGRRRPEEIENEELKGERAVTIPWVVFDLDAETREENGRHAETLLNLLSEHLTEGQLERTVCSYTGGTSIHVRVPAGFFGNPVFKDAESAARALSEFVDRLCEGNSELREAIDDRLFHPRQMVRTIGSTYQENTAPPDNSSWRPWLIRRLRLRPQIKGQTHAEEVADNVLDFLRERHLNIQDVDLQFEGRHAVTVSNAPDRRPNTNRVVACTGREFVEYGPTPLWARSECGTHQPFELPEPTEAEHVASLAQLLRPTTTQGADSSTTTSEGRPPSKKSDPLSVAEQPSSGEYERALQVTREGEKWGRDVDKPHLVGRNRAALTVSLVKLTHSEAPWRETCVWNRQMDEPLSEAELRKTFRSAERYLN